MKPEQLADRIVALSAEEPVLVAIDGIDAAGKTGLADSLAPLVEARGRPVVRASLDGFHRPRADRYAKGPDSAEGYYRDSYDLEAVKRGLLDPLGPGGSRTVHTAVFDWRTDAPMEIAPVTVPDDAVLIFDGVFVQQPILAHAWDLVIFLRISFETSLARLKARDGLDDEARFWSRYAGGQRLYLAEVDPEGSADIVIDNEG